MLPLRLCVDLALRALRRNRLQTALAVLGMTVGVGAVVTSMALGQGAQAAINEQLRAAGANVIVVTAGNYQIKGEEIGGGVVEHQARASDAPDAPDADRSTRERMPLVWPALREARTDARAPRGAGAALPPGGLDPVDVVEGRSSRARDTHDAPDADTSAANRLTGERMPLVWPALRAARTDARAPRGAGAAMPPGELHAVDVVNREMSRGRERAGVVIPAALYWDAARGVLRPMTTGDRAVAAIVEQPRLLLARHPEDDPLAVHNHPTAKQRLGDAMAGLGAAATLTRDDAEAIRREISGVQYVAAGVHENARVVAGSKQWFTRLHGADTELPLIRRGWSFPHGKYFGDSDVRSAAQVMVMGRVAADRLFGANVNPVGREVRLWNQPFQIVGVLTSKSWAVQPAPGDDQFDAVYVPFTTVHKLLNLSKLNTITVTAASVGDTTRISRDLVALLRKRHGIGESAPDDFTVRTQAQQALGHGLPPSLARVVTGNVTEVEQVTVDQLSRSLNRANWTMVGLLAGVATVSLLVGGIGIMNLLLLSVTERTREIGLRVALGARRQDVLMQFVSEAVLLSVSGGVLGIICGALASGGLAQIFRWAAVVSPGTVLLSVLVAALVGVAFGVYPARRAAQLDPIEALRHE
jgi:putative ABC transport system permease protein